MKTMKLYCLPYAGGSSASYLSWKRYAKEYVEVLPIELAGRGKRSGEPHYENMQDAVIDIYQIVSSSMEETDPYVLFGHSFGSLLAYELIFVLQEMGRRLPKALFVSGGNPPHNRIEDIRSSLPEQDLIEELINLGGITKNLVDSKEFIGYALPIIRADLKLLENYNRYQRQRPLDVPLYLLNGDKDRFAHRSCQKEWRSYTVKGCTEATFSGGHFFIKDSVQSVVSYVNDVCLSYLSD